MIKLGKLPPRPHQKLLMMSKYTSALPPAPESITYSDKTSNLGMMLNDRLGCCTCATIGHTIQAWTANAGTQITIPDETVLDLYRQACGFDPNDPSTDRGGIEADVLNFWRKHPDVAGGHALEAFAAAEPRNHEDIKDAVWLFGACYIGVALPISAQQQEVWAVPPGGATGQGAPGSWGGHAVVVVDYDVRGLTCITWGTLKRMTWQFWDAYCDEAYGMVSKDWIKADGQSPSGFNIDQLLADVAAL